MTAFENYSREFVVLPYKNEVETQATITTEIK